MPKNNTSKNQDINDPEEIEKIELPLMQKLLNEKQEIKESVCNLLELRREMKTIAGKIDQEILNLYNKLQ